VRVRLPALPFAFVFALGERTIGGYIGRQHSTIRSPGKLACTGVMASDGTASGKRAALHFLPRLTPLIIIHDVGERCATHRPKLSERISDRQDGVGMVAVRYPHRGLCFPFVD
jgi:hypothetical protein